jgi:diaminopimelate decarboxylase/aspartate kinase
MIYQPGLSSMRSIDQHSFPTIIDDPTRGTGSNCWATIVDLVKERQAIGFRPVIVHSALATVSNQLDTILQKAAAGMYSQQLHQVRKTHIDLARGLGLDGDSILGPLFGELEQMLGDIHQRGRLSPRAKAGVMSLGELMATTIGAAFLSAQGLQCTWMDARDVLRSVRLPGENERSSYLSAVCNIDPEQSVQGCFGRQAGVILTQGFIASNAEGESVLLGRGGSDTSAAYFAAKLSAVGLRQAAECLKL